MNDTMLPEEKGILQHTSDQKLKAVFPGPNNDALYIDYNGVQQSFRVQLHAAQRLFFFDSELFQKAIFRNEYGVIIGQLVAVKAGSGWLHLDNVRYLYVLSKDNTKLSLTHPQTKTELLTCTAPDALLTLKLDATNRRNLLYCYLFALAWALK